MDPTILQLFAPEEILERLAGKRRTGGLHLFTSRESANLFFQDGILVAAIKGLVEGEEVLKQVLEWRDANYSWQADLPAPAKTLKPLHINIEEYLKRGSGKAYAVKVSKSGSGSIQISASAKAATTMPVSLSQFASHTPTAEATTPVNMTATKNIDAETLDRSSLDAALLAKYPLVLVSMINPNQRIPIAHVSNLVGRNPACDITLSHASISRQHCLLQITDRGLHVKDLDTTNGTKVNGIRLTEGYINVGDKLTIGHLAFEVVKA
jgi:hypothetical protein